MMILISGAPGNGKSLRALALMLEEYERNREAVAARKEKPRDFHTNIRGVTFDWVKPIPLRVVTVARDAKGAEKRLEVPDYRACNDGAYVVFDEAHADGTTPELEEYGFLFPSTGKPGESDDERVRAMSTHRHRGFDLVFVTQWPSKIHHQIRTLCGKHIHLNRSMGLNVAGTLTWQRVQSDPYDEKAREKCDEEMWTFPSELFDKYKSATLHTQTYKFKIPPKVWSALSVAVTVCLIAWGAYSYSMPAKKAPEGEGRGAQTEGAPRPVRAPAAKVDLSSQAGYVDAMKPRLPGAPWTAPAYAGREVVSDPQVFCVSAGAGADAEGKHQVESCTCLTEQSTPYRLDPETCRAIARTGGAYNPFKRPQAERASAAVAVGGAGGSPPAVTGGEATDSPAGVGKVSEQQASYGAMRPEG